MGSRILSRSFHVERWEGESSDEKDNEEKNPSMEMIKDDLGGNDSMDVDNVNEGGDPQNEDQGDRSEGSDDDDDESDYDEELAEEYREWHREAMEMAQVDPDWHDPRKAAATFDDMAAGKQDNPFLKLLGSLRGTSVQFALGRELMFGVRPFIQGRCGDEVDGESSASLALHGPES